jgi:hypothetical protein
MQDESAGLKAKADTMKQYTDATAPHTTDVVRAEPYTGTKDRVNPTGAPFGTRGGEKRIDTTKMTKPLGMPSYKHGTDFVPETGPAMLHKGEKVTPAKENMKNMFSKITEGDAKPKKEIKRIIHTKMHDGKVHTTHEHHHPMHPDEHFAHNDAKEVKAHMDQAMGGASDGAPAGGDDQMGQLTASPSPAPAPAAGAMPGAGM